MQVDHCLILSAGKGTRMGEVGTILPKILWPIFEKNIFDLEVAFAKRFGVKNIYVNAHHLSEKLIDYAQKNHSDVKILHEEVLLDIGGAIHNVANELDYKGNLLILNGDQFLMYDKTLFQKALDKIDSCTACLFVIEKNSNEGYNAFEFDGSKITNLIQNRDIDRNVKMHTYSGMSLINLEKLTPSKGVSKYFETVANFNKDTVESVELDKYEYWDFGTIERYLNSCFKLLKNYKSGSPFIEFVKENRVIDENKMDYYSSYNCKSNNCINLTNQNLNTDKSRVVLLSGEIPEDIESDTIYFDGKCSKLPPLQS
jgi:NDP-sugar pyrophosphorylase family protein